ncbi:MULTISPECIES: hypothetical protein [unclassified Vibrio]|uniref:hypothetical protein n=1 Tax=unclassified Vibrio TaxID=2614977 RepID=UPI002555F416|nr:MULTISPECIES: hypothetical protein [unclassified Vibrio]
MRINYRVFKLPSRPLMPRIPLFILLSFGLFAKIVHGQDLWWQTILSDAPTSQVKQVIEDGGIWYDCEVHQQGVVFCLDDFHYYHQTLYGEAILTGEEIRFSFLTDFQAQNLNELILNLRKDGLVLTRVEIQGERYDVKERLKNNLSRTVDKELILFINRYSQKALRSMSWVLADEFDAPKPRLAVTLNSDGEMIELKVIRF